VTHNYVGMQLNYSSNCRISGNGVANNQIGIVLDYYSSNDTISGNNVTANYVGGISVTYSSGNTLSSNNVANNGFGIWFRVSSDNSVFHNNFLNNTKQVQSLLSNNNWDSGYPSGGNYWSDYNGVDANHDDIGDTPYIIDANNTDHYPLMSQYVIPEFPSFLILPLFMIATLLAVIIYKKRTVNIERLVQN
jgi:parallel beta-helix repeat protein